MVLCKCNDVSDTLSWHYNYQNEVDITGQNSSVKTVDKENIVKILRPILSFFNMCNIMLKQGRKNKAFINEMTDKKGYSF